MKGSPALLETRNERKPVGICPSAQANLITEDCGLRKTYPKEEAELLHFTGAGAGQGKLRNVLPLEEQPGEC